MLCQPPTLSYSAPAIGTSDVRPPVGFVGLIDISSQSSYPFAI
jgi:hypothetical protein